MHLSSFWKFIIHEVSSRMDGEPGDDAIVHGHIEILPFARFLTVHDGGKNGDGRHHSTPTDVCNLSARDGGVPILWSGQFEYAPQTDVIDIMARPLFVRSILSIS